MRCSLVLFVHSTWLKWRRSAGSKSNVGNKADELTGVSRDTTVIEYELTFTSYKEEHKVMVTNSWLSNEHGTCGRALSFRFRLQNEWLRQRQTPPGCCDNVTAGLVSSIHPCWNPRAVVINRLESPLN